MGIWESLPSDLPLSSHHAPKLKIGGVQKTLIPGSILEGQGWVLILPHWSLLDSSQPQKPPSLMLTASQPSTVIEYDVNKSLPLRHHSLLTRGEEKRRQKS